MTLKIDSGFDLADLKESVDVEFKLAEGKSGTGSVPKSFWETYSAMGNTEGGEVFLGVKQDGDKFEFKGIKNTESVVSDLWNALNNRQKVSVNLLQNSNIKVEAIEGVDIIRIHIPKASRKQKPVYINNNPITGSYRRYNEGDYHCDEETVRRMMANRSKMLGIVDYLKDLISVISIWIVYKHIDNSLERLGQITHGTITIQ